MLARSRISETRTHTASPFNMMVFKRERAASTRAHTHTQQCVSVCQVVRYITCTHGHTHTCAVYHDASATHDGGATLRRGSSRCALDAIANYFPSDRCGEQTHGSRHRLPAPCRSECRTSSQAAQTSSTDIFECSRVASCCFRCVTVKCPS